MEQVYFCREEPVNKDMTEEKEFTLRAKPGLKGKREIKVFSPQKSPPCCPTK